MHSTDGAYHETYFIHFDKNTIQKCSLTKAESGKFLLVVRLLKIFTIVAKYGNENGLFE